jgi:hypothetical protein
MPLMGYPAAAWRADKRDAEPTVSDGGGGTDYREHFQ